MIVTADKAFVGVGDIQKLLGVSRRTACRRIAEMKALGLGEVGRARYPADEVMAKLEMLAHQDR
jgi:Mn-dependent DtxR family transcriptional regulator